MHKFSLWWKIKGISPQRVCGRHPAQSTRSPHHWRRRVRGGGDVGVGEGNGGGDGGGVGGGGGGGGGGRGGMA